VIKSKMAYKIKKQKIMKSKHHKRAKELGMTISQYEMYAVAKWMYDDDYSNLTGKKQAIAETKWNRLSSKELNDIVNKFGE